MEPSLKEMEEQFTKNLTPEQMITKDNVQPMRDGMNGYLAMTAEELRKTENQQKLQIRELELNLKSIDNCYDDMNIKIFEIKSKENVDKVKPAMLYCHGGAACAGKAEDFSPFYTSTVLENDIIVYNVDYRLAPEQKAPKGILDCYAALLYVYKNAKVLKVNKNKIMLSGESGGAYIILGVCYELAKLNKTYLCKLVFPKIPMGGDQLVITPVEKRKLENQKNMKDGQEILQQYLADNLEKQSKDPYIQPMKMKDYLLRKVPPIVVLSCEFDFQVTDAKQFSRRLTKNGKLLDLIIIPEGSHGQSMCPRIADIEQKMVNAIISTWLK